MENTIRERKRLSDIHQHGCDDPRITRTHRDTPALIHRLNMANNQRQILLQNALRMPQALKHVAVQQIRIITHNRTHQITSAHRIRALSQIRSGLINIARQTIHQHQHIDDLMRQQRRRHISHIGITRIQRRPTNPRQLRNRRHTGLTKPIFNHQLPRSIQNRQRHGISIELNNPLQLRENIDRKRRLKVITLSRNPRRNPSRRDVITEIHRGRVLGTRRHI